MVIKLIFVSLRIKILERDIILTWMFFSMLYTCSFIFQLFFESVILLFYSLNFDSQLLQVMLAFLLVPISLLIIDKASILSSAVFFYSFKCPLKAIRISSSLWVSRASCVTISNLALFSMIHFTLLELAGYTNIYFRFFRRMNTK